MPFLWGGGRLEKTRGALKTDGEEWEDRTPKRPRLRSFPGSPVGMVLPCILSAHPAKYRRVLTQPSKSMKKACRKGLPVSIVSRVCNEKAAASGAAFLHFYSRSLRMRLDGVGWGRERAWALPSGPPSQGHLFRKRDAILKMRAVLDPPGCFYFRTRKARGRPELQRVSPRRTADAGTICSLAGREDAPACGRLSSVQLPPWRDLATRVCTLPGRFWRVSRREDWLPPTEEKGRTWAS